MILILFFTRKVSLKVWVEQGLFDREKLIYEEHLTQGNLKKVYWITYGDDDKRLSENLKKENRLHKDIEILQMPKIFKIPKIGSYIYSFLLPLFYKNELQESDILKTNQMDGSWSAVIAKWLYKKKLVVRTGYTLSQLEFSKNKNSLRYKYYVLLEKFAYKYCDIAMVTSQNNKKYLLENKFLFEEKIRVVPNFIDINLFKPLGLEKYENRILFVGRLNKDKGVLDLLRAFEKINKEYHKSILYIVGKDEENLVSIIQNNKLFNNSIFYKDFTAVPENYMSLADVFCLPSYREGFGSVIIEAAACGTPSIGSNIYGLSDAIEDNRTGLLYEVGNINDLFEKMQILITDKELLEKLSKNALDRVKNKFDENFLSDLLLSYYKNL